MKRTCLKCSTENPEGTGSIDEACPKCGAIYSKVAAAKAEPSAVDKKLEKARKKAAEQERRKVEWDKEMAEHEQRAQADEARRAAERKERSERDALQQSVCGKCGSIDWPKRTKRGMFGIELALLVLSLWFLVSLHILYALGTFIATICYTLWRQFSTYPTCQHCGSPDLIPASSPKGLEALRQAGRLPAEPSPQ